MTICATLTDCEAGLLILSMLAFLEEQQDVPGRPEQIVNLAMKLGLGELVTERVQEVTRRLAQEKGGVS